LEGNQCESRACLQRVRTNKFFYKLTLIRSLHQYEQWVSAKQSPLEEPVRPKHARKN